MKEVYFTPETICGKSRQMLQRLKRNVGQRNVEFMPEHCALLIVDMQRYFLDESSHAYIPSALSIIPKIKEISNDFLKKGLPVILTRHLNTQRDARCRPPGWSAVMCALAGSTVLLTQNGR